MTTQTYVPGTGKRKCAIVRVKLFPGGSGRLTVNGKPYEELFPRLTHQRAIMQPFMVTETVGKFDVEAKVEGGGISAWADAMRHGISRALVAYNENFKPLLRYAGLLTRDARVKERKKYGLKRARKSPQYTKR